MLTYKERDLLGGWFIEVRKGKVHIGNIRKNPSSGFLQYFKGPHNQLNYSYEEKSLEELKKKIEKELF